MKYGKLIAICGVDGVGKTTQINSLIEKFKKEGVECKVFRMKIGFTSWIETFRIFINSLGKKPNSIDPESFQIKPKELNKSKKKQLKVELYRLITILDLIRQLIVIRMLSRKEYVIICDRYIWDNHIIHAGKYPNKNLEKSFLWKVVIAVAKQPTISILLELPSKISIQRIYDRSGGDFEENVNYIESRKQKYDSYLKRAGWQIVDAALPPEKVFDKIWQKVNLAFESDKNV